MNNINILHSLKVNDQSNVVPVPVEKKSQEIKKNFILANKIRNDNLNNISNNSRISKNLCGNGISILKDSISSNNKYQGGFSLDKEIKDYRNKKLNSLINSLANLNNRSLS